MHIVMTRKEFRDAISDRDNAHDPDDYLEFREVPRGNSQEPARWLNIDLGNGQAQIDVVLEG